MKTLIVVDMQNDFITGSLGTKEAEAIIPNVRKKIEEYLNNEDQVIFTRDTHYEDYLTRHEGKYLPIPHCIKDTDGWKIHKDVNEDIDILGGCEYINKYAFGYDNWNWRCFKEVEIVGLCTDICVISNALILRSYYPEIEITVDASCCAGTTPEMHKKALDIMKNCHINIINEVE